MTSPTAAAPPFASPTATQPPIECLPGVPAFAYHLTVSSGDGRPVATADGEVASPQQMRTRLFSGSTAVATVVRVGARAWVQAAGGQWRGVTGGGDPLDLRLLCGQPAQQPRHSGARLDGDTYRLPVSAFPEWQQKLRDLLGASPPADTAVDVTYHDSGALPERIRVHGGAGQQAFVIEIRLTALAAAPAITPPAGS